QSETVLSSPAEARILLSGEKATERTVPRQARVLPNLATAPAGNVSSPDSLLAERVIPAIGPSPLARCPGQRKRDGDRVTKGSRKRDASRSKAVRCRIIGNLHYTKFGRLITNAADPFNLSHCRGCL